MDHKVNAHEATLLTFGETKQDMHITALIIKLSELLEKATSYFEDLPEGGQLRNIQVEILGIG